MDGLQRHLKYCDSVLILPRIMVVIASPMRPLLAVAGTHTWHIKRTDNISIPPGAAECGVLFGHATFQAGWIDHDWADWDLADHRLWAQRHLVWNL
jgi:hypothetical protein